MEPTEIASLKAEIARLNKIITILIEQNEVLKEQIAIASITNGNPNIALAYSKLTEGNPNVKVAFTKTTDGNTKVPIAFSNVTEGNPSIPLAFSKVTEGNPNVNVAFAKTGEGNPNILSPVAAHLTLSPGNIALHKSALKQEGFNKVRKSGVKNAALLLLHFYNKGRGDYTELRKLTGHSNFGLAKYLRSLKKRGLIQRDGWQKFKLTAHAIGLIQKAGCEG